MRTLKVKAQTTTAYFVTVNQMLGGYSQLSAIAQRGNQIVEQSSSNQTVLGSHGGQKLGGAAEKLIGRGEKTSLSFEL